MAGNILGGRRARCVSVAPRAIGSVAAMRASTE
eukprot:CAMPEP_0179465510 /NCGR_PEP_ID=MMETSP0799-20121207/47057_1 /TAXON_ID=46947 /ORGANISM="Geminigera cryophila, Strain CCMP2564" /LENGTH=32 /DNA_ID= /DNA_START= /DNA_END= /DNA_ORIENTATION=